MATIPAAPRRRRPGVADARAQARLTAALDAFRHGRGVAWSPPPPGPASAQTGADGKAVLQLGALTLADKVGLDKAALPRETALAHARAGRLDQAEAEMRGARFILSLVRLTPAGRAYGLTMHQAAESYLSYQRGDHAEAYARMEAALEATEELAAHWGNTGFIVCRRVDLTHNLMRVEVRRGDAARAMALGTGLLEQLTGVSGTEPALDSRVAESLFNLVVSTLAELLDPLTPGEAATLLASLDRVYARAPRPAWRAWDWLELKAEYCAGNLEAFVARAATFLAAGRERTPSLWYAVARDLERAWVRLAPASAQAAAAEIAGELRSGPRVPSSMRPGR